MIYKDNSCAIYLREYIIIELVKKNIIEKYDIQYVPQYNFRKKDINFFKYISPTFAPHRLQLLKLSKY